MRVAQSWLTEILQRATPDWEVTPEELDAGFVRVGLEVEELDTLEAIDGPLVVGKVVSITELTEFKKPIRFCQVEVGEPEPRGIVCGARNFNEGDLVVVALPGAVLPGGFEIATRKTYGQVSDGMICSVSELGIGKDHSGILVLEPGTAEPGADGNELLGLGDTIIELNITPDRGYCFSVRGLTRELACGFDLEYADPASVPAHPAEGEAWPVRLEPESKASRFVMRKITGIDPQAVSPWWLQRRLLLSGVRPISPAVDVTNYVMLELGQPLHAFDATSVQGDLVVRRAKAGEKLTTLDDVERTLDPEDVVIADDSGVISLAAVMGGATTEVGTATTDILLEGATWDPLAVFKTARRHKLPSEASKRFERVVDPAIPLAAVDRAAALLVEIAGGRIEPVLTDVGDVAPRAAIRMDIDLPTVSPESRTQRHRSSPPHPGWLQRRGRRQRRRTRPVGRDAAVVASGPGAACGPRRGSSSPRRSRADPVCASRRSGRTWVDSVAAAKAHGLEGRGSRRLRRGPSSGLPADERLRRLGPRRG